MSLKIKVTQAELAVDASCMLMRLLKEFTTMVLQKKRTFPDVYTMLHMLILAVLLP